MRRDRGQIEFWGYPGSGKTTLSNMLAASGVHVADIRRRSIAAKPFIVGQMLATEPLLWRGVRRQDEPANSLARAALFQSVAFAAIKGRPAIVQEGVINEIWRIIYRNPEEARQAWWSKYLQYAGPNVLILDISPEHSLNRIHTKANQGPVNRELATQPNGDEWSRAKAAYATMLDVMAGRDDLRVLKVPVLDTEPPEIILPRVMAAIASVQA